jgi:hypothetical protein
MLETYRVNTVEYKVMTSRRDATDRQPQSGGSVHKTDSAPLSFDPGVYNNLFIGMVLNMSWQLAVVVIVPIVGGYLLDQKLGSSPWLVLTGLAIAVLATCGLLWYTVRIANGRVAALSSKGTKK